VKVYANDNNLDQEILEQAEFRLRSTQGTLKSNADKLKRLEDVKIPDFDYYNIKSMSIDYETN
jgi:hypothetical protein